MTSVNVNYGALVALQNLNKTNDELTVVQNRINSGLKVASAKDNGATFAIAQEARGRLAGYGVAVDTVDKAISTLDAAITGGNTVSDLLLDLKAKATAATDASLTTSQRAAFNADFVQLREAVARAVSNAEFNGANAIKSGGDNITAFANNFGLFDDHDHGSIVRALEHERDARCDSGHHDADEGASRADEDQRLDHEREQGAGDFRRRLARAR